MTPEQIEKELKKLRKLICCNSAFSNISEFADNAAALLGGLTIGQIYRTGDVLKIVH